MRSKEDKIISECTFHPKCSSSNKRNLNKMTSFEERQNEWLAKRENSIQGARIHANIENTKEQTFKPKLYKPRVKQDQTYK